MKISFFLIAILFVVYANAEDNPCKLPGFFAFKENSPVFYGCYANKFGGLTMKYLSCQNGELFSSKNGYCVPKSFISVNNVDDENPDIEQNPTVPTEVIDTETPTIPSETETPQTEAPETETPETEAPETDTPETEAPETPKTDVRETETPETEAPETETPETEAPETDTTETEAPETETPETETPETEAPETPETELPETETPETEVPDTEAPETETPETEAPETETPETEAPETETPETEAPTPTSNPGHDFVCPTTGIFPQDGSCNEFNICAEIDGELKAYLRECPAGQNFYPIGGYCLENFSCSTEDPETEEPETEDPETEAPETEAPETPQTEEPETEAPETEAPETEEPETEAPETEAPETEAPETEAPETETPETEAPDTEEPETEAPETEAPETEALETEIPKSFPKYVPQTLEAQSFVCRREGTFAHANDCSKYYICKWDQRMNSFKTVTKQCSGTDVYNTLTATCGREGIITCLGRPINSKINRL